MTLHVTHEDLALLQESEAWNSWPEGASNRFTAEGVYGPKGALSFIWGKDFDNAEDLDGALCQNMGGGVPRRIISTLVEICVANELEE